MRLSLKKAGIGLLVAAAPAAVIVGISTTSASASSNNWTQCYGSPYERQGSSGTCAKAVQYEINRHIIHPGGMDGYPLLAQDGQFGPATKGAVQRYQFENGLQTDGIMGPVTWNSLDHHGPVTGF